MKPNMVGEKDDDLGTDEMVSIGLLFVDKSASICNQSCIHTSSLTWMSIQDGMLLIVQKYK